MERGFLSTNSRKPLAEPNSLHKKYPNTGPRIIATTPSSDPSTK